MYTTYGILVDSGANVTVENVWIYNYGNGVSFQQNAPNWTVRSSYFAYGRDGCVENDFQNNGNGRRRADGLLRPVRELGGYAVDGSANLFTVKNSLIHAEPNGRRVLRTRAGHDRDLRVGEQQSPDRALQQRVPGRPELQRALSGAPPGKLFDCANNVMIWLGAGPFPEPLPATFNGKVVLHAAHRSGGRGLLEPSGGAVEGNPPDSAPGHRAAGRVALLAGRRREHHADGGSDPHRDGGGRPRCRGGSVFSWTVSPSVAVLTLDSPPTKYNPVLGLARRDEWDTYAHRDGDGYEREYDDVE